MRNQNCDNDNHGDIKRNSNVKKNGALWHRRQLGKENATPLEIQIYSNRWYAHTAFVNTKSSHCIGFQTARHNVALWMAACHQRTALTCLMAFSFLLRNCHWIYGRMNVKLWTSIIAQLHTREEKKLNALQERINRVKNSQTNRAALVLSWPSIQKWKNAHNICRTMNVVAQRGRVQMQQQIGVKSVESKNQTATTAACLNFLQFWKISVHREKCTAESCGDDTDND